MAEGNGALPKLPKTLEIKSRGWNIFEYLKAEIVSKRGLLLYLMIPQLNINIIHSIDIVPASIGLRVAKHPYFIAKVKW